MAYVYWIHKPEDTDIFSTGYVGVTDRLVSERFAEHQRAARSGGEYTIHKAIRKYGDSLIVEIVLEGSTEYCYDLEKNLRPRFGIGYNCAAGGIVPTMLGMKHTLEAREKISRATRGENHPLFGKPVSEDAKRKMSEAQRGVKSPNFGKPLSEEVKAKCAEWRRNNPHPFEGKLPWELPRTNKVVWSKAEETFAFMVACPSAGIRRTAQHFNSTDAAYGKLYAKLKSGWNPSTDQAYLAWLSQYKAQQELDNEPIAQPA